MKPWQTHPLCAYVELGVGNGHESKRGTIRDVEGERKREEGIKNIPEKGQMCSKISHAFAEMVHCGFVEVYTQGHTE